MSVPYSLQHDGELCGVKGCASLAEAAADVPMDDGATIELALCVLHLAELHEADDPIELARTWVA